METIQIEITEFIHHCKYEKHLSSKTIKAYCTDLAQFTKFLLEKNLSVEVVGITKSEIRGFLEAISTLKPKSIKRKIATIKAMFNYLEFEDKILINPFRKMRIKIQEPKQLPKVMDIREVNSILKLAYRKNISCDFSSFSYMESLRNILVIELLFATGARVSEIADLREENINISSGAIIIKGKGNKERIIQICNIETLKILKQYHERFNEKIKNANGFFLINRLGKKLSDQSIRNIVKNLAVESKIQKHIR